MEPIVKVVYPTPPPTTNNLSKKQRSLLLRKAKKIEQILGYPPHLLDTLHISDGSIAPCPPLTGPMSSPSEGRSSIESSSPTLDSLEDENDVSWFCYGNRSSGTISSHKNGLSQIPLLRVASKSLHLELTAMTNWPVNPTDPSTDLPDLDLSFKLDPAIVVPTFTIPTSHTHRKAKMDRIRKKLGSEVPYKLVFPEDFERGHDKSTNHKSLNSEKLLPRRRDAVMKSDRPLSTLPDFSPAYLPSPSIGRLERRRPPTVIKAANEKLSLIPECLDESSGGSAVDFWGMKDGIARCHNTTEPRLSMCSQNSAQCAVRSAKRPPSYRKPPPPILDDSVCSF